MSTGLWGKYRAQVIDVKDPEQRGRILVKSPKVLGDFELGWANSCLPPGVFNLPEVDDFVYIEFEQGKVEYPVWVGLLFTSKYVKSSFFPDSDYDPKAMKIIAKEDMELLPAEELLIGGDAGDRKPVARKGDPVTGTAGPESVVATISDSTSKVKSI